MGAIVKFCRMLIIHLHGLVPLLKVMNPILRATGTHGKSQISHKSVIIDMVFDVLEVYKGPRKYRILSQIRKSSSSYCIQLHQIVKSSHLIIGPLFTVFKVLNQLFRVQRLPDKSQVYTFVLEFCYFFEELLNFFFISKIDDDRLPIDEVNQGTFFLVNISSFMNFFDIFERPSFMYCLILTYLVLIDRKV